MSSFRRRLLSDNGDDYALIHWHSGADALVDGKWMDRVRDIPGETPLDWVNYGCTWDSADKCYKGNGVTGYMKIPDSSGVVFGTDFYIEIEISSIGLGSYGVPIDFGSVTAPPDGTCSLGFIFNTSTKIAYGNFKYNGNSPVYPARLDFNLSYFDRSKFSFGVKGVSEMNGAAFAEYHGNKVFSSEFLTISVGITRPLNVPFHLFRGVLDGYAFNGSIYDIKIYKRNKM